MGEEKKLFNITKIDEDTYSLSSLANGETLIFKKNVQLSRKIQSVNANARLKMIQWMKDNQITKNDLIDKRTENGKIIYDETNYREIERGFINDETISLSQNITNTLFNMDMEALLLKLGFTNDDEKEANRLGTEINKILTEKFPR